MLLDTDILGKELKGSGDHGTGELTIEGDGVIPISKGEKYTREWSNSFAWWFMQTRRKTTPDLKAKINKLIIKEFGDDATDDSTIHINISPVNLIQRRAQGWRSQKTGSKIMHLCGFLYVLIEADFWAFEKDDGSPFITRNSIKSPEAESQNAFWTLTSQDRYDELFDRIVDTSDLSNYFEEVTLIYHSCLEESIRERDGVDICVSDKLLVDLEPEKTGIGTHLLMLIATSLTFRKKGNPSPVREPM